jgi:hypothetical protein
MRDLSQFTICELRQIASFPVGDIPPQDKWPPEFLEMMVERQQAELLLQQMAVKRSIKVDVIGND